MFIKILKLIGISFICNLIGMILFFLSFFITLHFISIDAIVGGLAIVMGFSIIFMIPELVIILLFHYFKFKITYFRIFIIIFFMGNIFYPYWINALFFDYYEYLYISGIIIPIIFILSFLFYFLVKKYIKKEEGQNYWTF